MAEPADKGYVRVIRIKSSAKWDTGPYVKQQQVRMNHAVGILSRLC